MGVELYHANTDQKKAGVAIIVSGQAYQQGKFSGIKSTIKGFQDGS
jgi:hypothetical protein